MGAPVVETRGLGKEFRVRHERLPSVKRLFTGLLRRFPTERLWALQDVSIAIAAGEAVGVIGHNGSGKSTLLRVIAGIIRATRGELIVRGRAGGLFELAAGLNPELRGRDNIFLSGALMGYPPATVRRYLDAIIDFSELGQFVDVPVKTYSSGMGLRLGFAIAITFEPEVLLVDEVLAVADEHFQRKAYRALRRVQQRGSAVVMVSHEMKAIRELCPRVLWLEQGRVVADGPAEEVIARYLERVGAENGA
jgi:ABC-type polysaccharide/polyol phosphate transport system ATPase subunit